MASTRSARAPEAAAVETAPPAAAAKAPVKKAAVKKGQAKKTAPKKAAPKKIAAKKRSATKASATAAPPKKASAKAAPTTTTSEKGTASTKRTGSATRRSPFSAAFLRAQRAALEEERATYLGQAETLEAEARSLVDDVDPGDVQFDEESGEGDSLAIERDRDLALSAQARQAVEEIDHALAKFDLGTYGICEVSGEPIPTERLEAIPWARERVEYKVGGLGRR